MDDRLAGKKSSGMAEITDCLQYRSEIYDLRLTNCAIARIDALATLDGAVLALSLGASPY